MISLFMTVPIILFRQFRSFCASRFFPSLSIDVAAAAVVVGASAAAAELFWAGESGRVYLVCVVDS